MPPSRRGSSPARVSVETTPRWRTWLPHRSPVAEQLFVGGVRQFVGGRRWALCLVTRIHLDATGVTKKPTVAAARLDSGEEVCERAAKLRSVLAQQRGRIVGVDSIWAALLSHALDACHAHVRQLHGAGEGTTLEEDR